MLREGNKLRHRSQRLIEAVKLVAAATCARDQAGVAIQGALDSAISGEIHDHLGVVVDLQKCHGMLVGVYMSDRAESRGTPIRVGQVNESVRRVAVTTGCRASDPTFVEVHRPA